MSGGVTFKKVPIDSPGDMATVDEVKDNKDKVMGIMDEWTIALLDGGKVDGRGHGGKVYHGNYMGQCGEKIIIFGRVPKDLKFKKVPCDHDSNRMATVAEARANHEKVLSLLDEWTIALLDGGKVDGPGHGGKVQEGDFTGQCGEKIIVEGSGINEIEANIHIASQAQSMAPATPGYPNSTQYYQFCGVQEKQETGEMAQELAFKKVPVTSDGRMATVAEARANYEKVSSLLDEWTIALLDGGKVDGRGHGGQVQDGDFREGIGEKIVAIGSSRVAREVEPMALVANASHVQAGVENLCEPSYMAVRAGSDGNVCVPEGWNITGVLDPALHGVMKQFIKNRTDADEFNKGNMVIITNTLGANSTPEWIVVEKNKYGQFQLPPGFNFAELEGNDLGPICQKFGERGSLACDDLQVKVRKGNVKFAKRICPEVVEYKFKKVPKDCDGDLATVAEARANHEKVLSLLDEWTIALLDGGKVDGPGHGGKVQDGDFTDQCGEKIIVLSGRVKPPELKFKRVPIDHEGRMATVAEVRENRKIVMSLLDQWSIAQVDGGKVDGPGHGWNIHEGNFQGQCGEKIIVEGGSLGIREPSMLANATQQAQTAPGGAVTPIVYANMKSGYDLTNLKFKKVPVDHDGWNRMATVAEARANHEKLLSLLDEWTIALLDGGKVDGPGHGGKIQEGDFKSQCGDKIIVD